MCIPLTRRAYIDRICVGGILRHTPLSREGLYLLASVGTHKGGAHCVRLIDLMTGRFRGDYVVVSDPDDISLGELEALIPGEAGAYDDWEWHGTPDFHPLMHPPTKETSHVEQGI